MDPLLPLRQPTTPLPQTKFYNSKTTDEAKLNKTERAFLEYLRALRKTCIGVQNITLQFADDCGFRSDFSYIEAGRLILIDVKGFQREGALIQIKVAAIRLTLGEVERRFELILPLRE